GGVEARPAQQSLIDRSPEPGVETAGVAEGRVAHPEGLLDHAPGPDRAGATRLVEPPAMREVVAVRRQVIVTVDQPRQHGHAGDVDDLGAGRPRPAGRAHALDAV